jgi:hypothetical protein
MLSVGFMSDIMPTIANHWYVLQRHCIVYAGSRRVEAMKSLEGK